MPLPVTHPAPLPTAARPLTGTALGMISQAALSPLTTKQYSVRAAVYQAAGARAVAVHELITLGLPTGAGSHAVTETVNTTVARRGGG